MPGNIVVAQHDSGMSGGNGLVHVRRVNRPSTSPVFKQLANIARLEFAMVAMSKATGQRRDDGNKQQG